MLLYPVADWCLVFWCPVFWLVDSATTYDIILGRASFEGISGHLKFRLDAKKEKWNQIKIYILEHWGLKCLNRINDQDSRRNKSIQGTVIYFSTFCVLVFYFMLVQPYQGRPARVRSLTAKALFVDLAIYPFSQKAWVDPRNRSSDTSISVPSGGVEPPLISAVCKTVE